jgi:hypothetical protein
VSEERELAKALAVANEDRARLRAALEEAKRQRARAEEGQEQAEQGLRRLEASRSWRLTRPLRGAGEALRSLARRRN